MYIKYLLCVDMASKVKSLVHCGLQAVCCLYPNLSMPVANIVCGQYIVIALMWLLLWTEDYQLHRHPVYMNLWFEVWSK